MAGQGDCPFGLGAEPARTKHPFQEKGGATGAVGRERGQGLTALLGRAGAGPRERPPGAGRGHVCTQPPRRARLELRCLLLAQLPARGRCAGRRPASGEWGPRRGAPSAPSRAGGDRARLRWVGARDRECGPEPAAGGGFAAQVGGRALRGRYGYHLRPFCWLRASGHLEPLRRDSGTCAIGPGHSPGTGGNTSN